MPNDLLMFITWKTYNGKPMIDQGAAEHLEELLPRLAASERAVVLELAIMPDHVHVVVEYSPSASLPRLLQRLKGASSRLVNRDGSCGYRLKWQAGYDARTVGRRHLARVREYLDIQARRHEAPLLARWSSAAAAPSHDSAA